MTDDSFILSNSLLLQRLGWVFLHFLWQGLAALTLLVVALHLVPRPSALVRFRLACAALGGLALCPIVTFLVVGDDLGPEPLSQAVSGLGVGWICGSAVLGFLVIIQALNAELHRVVATQPLPTKQQEHFRHLTRRFGVRGTVVFRESRLVATPATIGWLRPVVLIPPRASEILGLDKLDTVVAHELAHILRRDFLGAFIQSLVELALFFHPAVWCVSRTISDERECCCDDLAVIYCRDEKLYASALHSLVIARDLTNSLAMMADDGSLTSRIRRILGGRAPRRISIRGRSMFLSTAGLVLLVACAAGYSYRVQARPNSGPAPQPVVAVELVPEVLTYDSPVDIKLPTNGRYAFRATLWKGHRRNTITAYLETPGAALMQVIPLEEEFKPVLNAAWACRHGPDHMDGDLGSGRGRRPFHRVVCAGGPPSNWIRFEICAFHAIETPVMPNGADYADYIGVIWQPHSFNDYEPNVLGPESTPVLLDKYGRGDPHLRKGISPPPTLDYPHDVDTFQVRSHSDKAMTITVDGHPSKISPFLRVYDQYGHLRTAAPDQRQDVAELTVRPEATGERFYFAVTAYDATGTGEYVVRVTQPPQPNALTSLE